MIDGRTERTGSRSLACWLVTLVATGALAAGCGDESSPAPIVDAGSDARGGAGGAGGGGGTPGAGGADAAQGGAGGAMDAPVDNPPVDAPGEVQPTDGGSDTDEIDTAPPSNPAPEDLDGLQWTPTFEPDYNRLTPQPWVELASTTQTQEVIVLPDRLIFPAATNQEVLQWEPGRVVVSPPGNGIGSNAMGYARKVRTVATVGNAIEVMTETPSLSEIITGDVQHTFDYGQMQDMDLSKMDLQWAADNLYTDAPMLSPEMDADHIQYDDPLPDVDENFEPLPGDPLFGNIFKAVAKGVSAVGNAIGGAAKAVANTAVNVYRAVTPASFGGSVSISSALDIKYKSDLFVISYRKNFNAMGRRPIQLHISGNGNIDSSIYFRPGTQMGMRIPNLGHNTTFATWLNVDSQFRAYLKVGLDLTTALESAGGMSGKALEDAVNAGAEFAEDVLAQVKQKATGNPDMKPAGGWKRTVFITKPAMQTVFAGPIPVIFTQTFQVDVECGFSLQAQLKANLEYERVSNLKFNAHYESSRVTGTTPIFENRKSTSVQVTGGGSAAVSCGIIPRLNVFVYDTAGLNAGVRGSLVAKAAMESTCVPNPTVSKPKGEVSVGLYGNIGVQVGGRLQAPGSSWAGKSGTSAGFDIGPFEPWNTEFPLYEKKWTLAQGLGYCTPLCRDGVRNAMETDRDCGGGACGACANGQLCARTTDCARGFCAAGRCSLDDHCGDGIRNGDETGIDCGGAKCKKCRNAVACFLPRDCMSGFCAVKPGTGSRSGNCVANHCTDFTVTGNESGIDCGGATCAKCALGVATTVAADCASGFGNGRFCVANACLNQLKEANESDVDCGGTSACGRCSKGQACTGNSDCAAAAPTCDVVTKRCVSASCTNGARDGSETDVDCGGTCPGKCTADKICSVAGDCGAGLDCGPTKTCVAPTCTDARKNGSESDVDCGGSCPGGCPRDKACNTKEDCASVLDCNPTSKLCVIPLCTDGRKNRDETDVDCGASCPNRCVADQICAVTGDCAVGLECSPEKRCTGSTCTDGRKGGAESDVDCGSVCPTRCAAGKICGITGDCAAGLECGPGATCVAPTCTDGRANGVETGVDCGGTCPNGCPAALSCTVDADCVAGLECSPAKLCVVPTCVDARKNRDETDVDCGGSCLARCGFSQACAGTGDCVAGLECSPGNICVAPTCSDARRNRDETDVDCGGTACTARCATNQGCFFTADCAMGLECGPAGKCVAPTCFDSRKNQNETDVDCGGLCMLRCAATQMCGTSVDCAAGLECGPGNLCVAPTCSDARKNQNETDVDCGGACTGCAATKACLVNGDCAMGLECGPGNLCVAPTCSDARKNQNESDVDCGGVCTGCALTKVCNGDVDCAAGLDCDNTNHCVVGCAAGRWIDNGVCTDAGVGFWAPGGGTIRTACVNKPANSSYTSATASSANCPWVCDAGFLRSGGMCVVSANARELRCNPDEVGIGIYGRAGAWLDAMGIRCATLTGTTLGAPRAVASVGGNGGDPFTYDCQAGEALVKVTGKNGFSTAGPNAGWCSTTNLSTITIHCKNLTTGVVSQRNTAGGAQGACQVPLSTFDFNCETIVGAGSLMNGFIVDAANTMTYVGFVLDTACR